MLNWLPPPHLRGKSRSPLIATLRNNRTRLRSYETHCVLWNRCTRCSTCRHETFHRYKKVCVTPAARNTFHPGAPGTSCHRIPGSRQTWKKHPLWPRPPNPFLFQSGMRPRHRRPLVCWPPSRMPKPERPSPAPSRPRQQLKQRQTSAPATASTHGTTPPSAFRMEQASRADKIMEARKTIDGKECPNCTSSVPVNTTRCRCGFAFVSGSTELPSLTLCTGDFTALRNSLKLNLR